MVEGEVETVDGIRLGLLDADFRINQFQCTKYHKNFCFELHLESAFSQQSFCLLSPSTDLKCKRKVARFAS
jgi:hypothetical protein